LTGLMENPLLLTGPQTLYHTLDLALGMSLDTNVNDTEIHCLASS
jgi:hypothetical protein